MGFADGFIRAHREGAQQKLQQEQQQLEAMLLKHRLAQMKIDERRASFEQKKRELDLLQGQPSADLPGQMTMGEMQPGVAGMSGESPMPSIPALGKQFNPVMFPTESGGEMAIRPQSAEQMASAAMQARFQESVAKAREAEMMPRTYSTNQIGVSGLTGQELGRGLESPAAEPGAGSNFNIIRKQRESELGRPLTSDEMMSLDRNPSAAALNALREQMLTIQVEQLKAATQSGQLNQIQSGQADKLRDDFNADSTVKDFQKRYQSYETILSTAKDTSPAGDLSLIFAYMKMLDPGSVVREGEFATAQNTASVPDRVRNAYNKALKGERLNPTQRADFINQAKNIYQGSKASFTGVKRIYDSRAAQQKIPAHMITFELPDPGGAGATSAAQSPAATTSTGPAVGERRTINGQLVEWDGKGWFKVGGE